MKQKRIILIFVSVITLSISAFSHSGLIQIEKSRKIYMNCQGKGTPTVVLISGYPDRGDASWETRMPGKKGKTVFSAVSTFTKVCDYDRPGTIKIIGNKLLESRSDPVPQPVTAENQVNDLRELIKAAKINKPFILVAHSAGGLIARLYALKYPHDVSGLILIDVTNEKLFKTWSKKEIAVFHFGLENGAKELISHYNNVEVINFDESFKQLEHYQDQKLPIPAVVLTAGKVPDAREMVKNGYWPDFVTQTMSESIIKGIYRANDLVAKTFIPTAQRINVKNSGHYIQKEQPEFIINLIRTMVTQQRVL